MSAPGSLACAKLLYPETEESIAKNIKELELPPRLPNLSWPNQTNFPVSNEKNAMECVSAGSLSAVNVVTAVLANLISFVAIMAFFSGIIGYAGTLLGYDDWSLELFFGYAFSPLAYLIGVTDSVEETLVICHSLFFKSYASNLPRLWAAFWGSK